MKREDRIYKAIEKPTKLSDYMLIEGRNSNRKKGTKKGYKYRWLIPGLLMFASALSILLTVLFL